MIRQHGLLSTQELKRRNLFANIKTGGDSISLQSDAAKGTDAYVCLCFTRSHPMAHVAMNDERKLDPVYLEIDPQVIKLGGVMMTNAPSNQNGVERVAATKALDELDLDVIYKRTDWTDATIQARLQKAEKYEILIPRMLPTQYVVGGF